MVTIRSAVVFGLAQLFYLRAAWAIAPQQLVQELQSSLSNGSEVVLTSDPAYTKDFTARFSNSQAPSFIVGVKPALVTDVQKVVRYASRNRVPFLAVGGGHGYTWTLGGLQGGIQLDMGNFQTIEIDAAANTMKVGGAVRIGNVTSDLYASGKEFPVGMCSTVGFTGFTLGGGVGPFGGIHGTASDALLSAEIITGTGELLNVSATQHPGLFYGLRGAGFNYGVVTSLKYRVYPARNQGNVMVTNAIFPPSLTGALLKRLNVLSANHPKELSVLFAIRFNKTMGGMVSTGTFIYAGPEAEGQKVIKPFLDLHPSDIETTIANYHTYSSVALYGEVGDIGPMKGITFAPYTINLYKVDAKNIGSVMDYMNATLTANPDVETATLSWAQYSPFGFHKYPDASSAFPFRDTTVYFSYDGFTTDSTKIPALDQLGKEIRSRLLKGSGKPNLETYVHFGHGDEGPSSWYTPRKLPALKALKAVYDPLNLFSHYNPVPLH